MSYGIFLLLRVDTRSDSLKTELSIKYRCFCRLSAVNKMNYFATVCWQLATQV